MNAEITVAPGLLIAMPQLTDPNFHRSVVLMVKHGGDGSFGLVINRQMDQKVSELLTPLEIRWQGNRSDVAWWGGPVQPETGWILHEPVAELGDQITREIAPGLHLSSAPDALKILAKNPPKRIRFILGYSGWGPDQLEGELADGSWVNSDVTPELVFETPPEKLWETSVRRLGIEPQSLVPASGVH